MREPATKEALRVDVEPRRLLVTSEPYVVYSARGYQPVVDVLEKKSRREYFLYLSAISLSHTLHVLQEENGGRTLGLEFWLRKESHEKTSKYILEE